MARLADVALLRPLGADCLRRLEARCSFVRHEANELIIDFDDLSSDVYFVVSGKVRILYRAGNGKEVILGELIFEVIERRMSASREDPEGRRL